MSMRAEIISRVLEQRLFRVESLLPPKPPRAPRELLVTKQLSQALEGPWLNATASKRWFATRQRLEQFVNNDLMVVRMAPSKDVEAMLAQLEPASDNVWEFRLRDPTHIRVFGMFASRNVFIGTNFSLLENLKTEDGKDLDTRKWRDAMITCKTEWKNLFPSYEPVKGSNLRDYISNAQLLV